MQIKISKAVATLSPAICGAALLLAASAAQAAYFPSAPTIDGSGITAANWGPPAALQTVDTGFGNNTSELDAMYVGNDGTNLYLAISGNLENNGNPMYIFLDTQSGGATNLADPALSYGEFDDISDDSGAVQLPTGFGADYGFVWQNSGGGCLGTANYQSNTSAFISCGGPYTPYSLGFDNTNSGGVGGTASTLSGDGSTVTTGIEMTIPLANIGSPTLGSTIKVIAMISGNGGADRFFSNQILPGLPGYPGNLGTNPNFSTNSAQALSYTLTAGPLAYDSFNYSAGTLTTTTNDAGTLGTWTRLTGGAGTTPPQVLSTSSDNGNSLEYSAMPVPANNRLKVNNAGEDDTYLFSSPALSSGSVYASFFVKPSVLANTTGDYFFHFKDSGTSNLYGRIGLVQNGTSLLNRFQMRIATNAITPFVVDTTDLTNSTTYFVVAKYTFVSGATNDTFQVWVNPASTSLGGPNEPTATLSQTNAATGPTDIASIQNISIRQATAANNNAPEVDEIRVGTTWASVTTPRDRSSVALVEVAALDGVTNIADGSGSVSFGTANQGGSAVDKVITVNNTGAKAMTLGTPTLTTGTNFSIIGTLPPSIPGNGSTSFTVRMLTANSGSLSDTVTFTNSDSDEGTFDFAVTGTVTPPPTVTNASFLDLGTALGTDTGIFVAGSGLVNGDGSIRVGVNTSSSETITGIKVWLSSGSEPGSFTAFASSGLTHIYDGFDVTGADGAKDINVRLQSAAGGSNTFSPAGSTDITLDTSLPSVVLTSGAADPTNASSFSVSAAFSEGVGATFTISPDVSVGNGAASNQGGSSPNFTFDVSPTGDGSVTVDIAANGAADSAGNGNTAATQLTRLSDRTNPTATITRNGSTPTNADSVSWDIDFDEPTTLVSGDITINGVAGTLGLTGPAAGDVYTATVTFSNPNANGSSDITIAATGVDDVAGNLYAGATSPSYTIDNTSLTANIAEADPNPTSLDSVDFTVTFSAAVGNGTVFNASDITLTGTLAAGAAVSVTGGTTIYNVNVTPTSGTADGTLGMNVNAGAGVQDGAGNPCAGATGSLYTIDNSAPTTSVTAPSGTFETPSSSFNVSYTSDDAGATVHLFYQKTARAFTEYGSGFTSSPISFDTATTGGDGTYELYVVGEDAAGNVEAAPGAPDVTVMFHNNTSVGDWTVLDAK